MTVFAPGQTVRSREPVMPVDALDPGVHRFQLVVVDNDRNESAPAELRVTVLKRGERPPIDTIGRIPIDRILVERVPPPPPPPRPRPGDTILRPPVRPGRPG